MIIGKHAVLKVWRRSFAPLGFLITAQMLTAADIPKPMPWPKERYAGMTTRSPFAPATSPEPIAAPRNSFAANWFITGLGQLNGEVFVSIKARDLSTQFSLYGQEPRNGVTLAGVTWSNTVGKSTVILRKGAETARLEFNEAELRQPSGGVAKNGRSQSAPAPAASRSGPSSEDRGGISAADSTLQAQDPRRQVPTQVARWMSASTTSAGANPVPQSGGGTLQARANGSGAFSPEAAPQSAPATARSEFTAAQSQAAVVPPAEAAATAANRQASSPSASREDTSGQIPPQVAKWLSPEQQAIVLRRRAESLAGAGGIVDFTAGAN